MKLDLTATYKRIDNVLYCNDTAIIKFTHSKFPDFDPLSEQGVKYMQSYINMWPQHFEILIEVVISTDINEKEAIEKYMSHERVEKQTERFIDFEQPVPEWSELDFNPQWSRQQQVQFYLERGYTSASSIAQKIDANPTYVQRLIKQLQNESQTQK